MNKNTYTKDYVDKVHEKFPEFSKKDILRIMDYGWRSLYQLNVYGGDTLIKDDNINKFLFYIGNLTYDSLKHYSYYKFRMVKKLRILSKKNYEFDGYYYLALTSRNVRELRDQFKVNKRKYKFTRLFLYKLFEEPRYNIVECEYLIRVHVGIDIGFKFFKTKYETTDIEYVWGRFDDGFKPINNPKQYFNKLFKWYADNE